MPKCVRIKRKSRKICIGDMREQIQINIRTIKAPVDGSVDFAEAFQEVETVFAMVETKTGVEIFDGTNLLGVATHFFYIRFISDIDFTHWVRFKDQFFDILDVQNLEERNEFYLLRCSLRGDETKPINFSR